MELVSLFEVTVVFAKKENRIDVKSGMTTLVSACSPCIMNINQATAIH